MLVAVVAPSAAWAGELYSWNFDKDSDFEGQFRVTDKSGSTATGGTWVNYSYTTGPKEYHYARCYAYSKRQYDDYMTLKSPLSLQPGTAYKVSFDYWDDGNDSGRTALLEVGFGTGSDETQYTMLPELTGKYINKYQGQTPERCEIFFEVPAQGEYYLTFHSKGSGGIGFDTLVVEDAGNPASPLPLSALTVTAAPDFSTSATLAMTLPEKTITGGELLSVTSLAIERNGESLTTLTDNLAPGAEVSWTDANAPEGEVEYTVYVLCGELRSAPVSASAFVGPLVPQSPANVTLAAGEGGYTVSWQAPTKSVNDLPLDQSLLSYQVSRKCGDEEAVVLRKVTDLSYTDNYVADSRVELSYTVAAVYGEKYSAESVSNVLKVGPVALPFAESFAGASPGEMEAEKITGSYTWEAAKSGSSPTCQPQDSDGGLVTYRSYNSQTGNSARLITPEIVGSSATNLTLTYWIYKNTSGNNDDHVVIEVSKDGADWVTVDGSKCTVKGDKAGWEEQTLSLQSYVAGATRFRVAVRAISGYGYNTHIDNVKLFNALTKDLVVAPIEIDAVVNAGTSREVKVSVTNKGADALAAGDYSIALLLDEDAVDMAQGPAIQPNETVDVTFKLAFNALHAGKAHKLTAKVLYDDDEDMTNNEAEADFSVVASAHPTVLNFKAEHTDDGILLSWEAPIDNTGYEPTEISEDFANCTNVNSDETILGGTDWTVVDADGVEAATTSYGFKSGTWNVFESTSSYAPQSQRGGKFIAMISPRGGAPDDWLISPELKPFDGMYYNLEFSAGTNTDGSKFEVLYSETTPAIASFTLVQEVAVKKGYSGFAWNNYSVAVPGTAKYIAIRNVSASSDYNYPLVGIDYVSVKSDLPLIVGYNVYDENGKINDEPLSETQYLVPENDLQRETGVRTFRGTALYDDGESIFSEAATLTGVTSAETPNAGVSIVPGGIETGGAASVYTLDGRRVAHITVPGRILLPSGVYIVRSGGSVIKVAIR